MRHVAGGVEAVHVPRLCWVPCICTRSEHVPREPSAAAGAGKARGGGGLPGQHFVSATAPAGPSLTLRRCQREARQRIRFSRCSYTLQN